MSKNFGFEKLFKSSWFDGFIAKPHQFFSTNFWQCCQSCIQDVQMDNLWKNVTFEKSFEIDKITGCLLKNLGQLSESFRQFRRNCILTVESRFWGEILFVRKKLFQIFFGVWAKNYQVFWETVSARVYELLSTSTKEMRFCRFSWETFVFQSVCNFSNFVGFEATFSQFFSIEFFGSVVKAAFRCPEEHFMEKINLKQPFF